MRGELTNITVAITEAAVVNSAARNVKIVIGSVAHLL